MPFKIVTTVVHEGRPDYHEPLIVHTTGGKRICVMVRTQTGKNFMIRPRDWPKPVLQAAEELVSELRQRGKAIDLPDINAWIDSKRGLVVGERVHVLLIHGDSARNKTVILRGIITGFTIP